MRTLICITSFLMMTTLGCGGGGGGGGGSCSVPDSVDAGVAGSTAVSALTSSEAKTMCENFGKELTPTGACLTTVMNGTCKFGAMIAIQFGAGDGGDPVDACEAVVTDCLNSFETSDKEDNPCDTLDFSDCDATVDEVYACGLVTTEASYAMVMGISTMSCADLVSSLGDAQPMESRPAEPIECSSLKEKCPTTIFPWENTGGP